MLTYMCHILTVEIQPLPQILCSVLEGGFVQKFYGICRVAQKPGDWPLYENDARYFTTQHSNTFELRLMMTSLLLNLRVKEF